MSKPSLRVALMAIIILLLVIIVAFVFLKPADKLPKPVSINTNNQPTIGNPNAKIHIVVFEDLKCRNCARFNTTLLPKIKKKYIDTGIAKYTMINLAFIEGSMPAANTARCLYMQNKQFFFIFIKHIYENQPSETKNWATIPTLMQFSNNIKGVNKKKLEQCVLNNPYTAFINQNLKLARNVMGDRVATPTVYVNGRIVKPLTMHRFETLINAAKKD